MQCSVSLFRNPLSSFVDSQSLRPRSANPRADLCPRPAASVMQNLKICAVNNRCRRRRSAYTRRPPAIPQPPRRYPGYHSISEQADRHRRHKRLSQPPALPNPYPATASPKPTSPPAIPCASATGMTSSDSVQPGDTPSKIPLHIPETGPRPLLLPSPSAARRNIRGRQRANGIGLPGVFHHPRPSQPPRIHPSPKC